MYLYEVQHYEELNKFADNYDHNSQFDIIIYFIVLYVSVHYPKWKYLFTNQLVSKSTHITKRV